MKNCYKHGGKAGHPAKAMMSGGDPTVLSEAKKKTTGIISGDGAKVRADKPMRRASGGRALAPASSNSPMACTAKPGR